jgi:hypothetical protein
LAQLARRFQLELPRPGRVQEQVTTGGGADNSEDHIEPARLSFNELLIANLCHRVSDPPTEKSDQQKQYDFVHYYLPAFAAAIRRLDSAM